MLKVRCMAPHRAKAVEYEKGEAYELDDAEARRLVTDFPERFKRVGAWPSLYAQEVSGDAVRVRCLEPHRYKTNVYYPDQVYAVTPDVRDHLVGDFPQRFEVMDAPAPRSRKSD